MSSIKVKLKRKKNLIPTSSSYMGLDVPVWERLNAGKEVLIDEISELLSDYVEEVKEKKTKVKRK